MWLIISEETERSHVYGPYETEEAALAVLPSETYYVTWRTVRVESETALRSAVAAAVADDESWQPVRKTAGELLEVLKLMQAYKTLDKVPAPNAVILRHATKERDRAQALVEQYEALQAPKYVKAEARAARKDLDRYDALIAKHIS